LGLVLADYYDVGVGGTISIGENGFTVVGIFDSGNDFANRYAYISLSEAQSLFDLAGQVSSIQVFAGSVSDVNGIVDAITSMYGDSVSVTTQSDLLSRISQQYQQIEERVALQFSQTQGIANQEIMISIIVGGLIVLFTMFYTVRERTREIGILKALGFTNGKVMAQFMLEGVIISLMGGLAGCVIGSVGAPILANLLLPQMPSLFGFRQPLGQLSGFALTGVAPDVHLILLGLGVAVLLGVLGSLYPSWWASRKRPVEALRYE